MGDARPKPPSEPGFDLFDRWLAHHEQRSADVARDEPEPPADPALESPLFEQTSEELDLTVEELIGETTVPGEPATELVTELVDPLATEPEASPPRDDSPVPEPPGHEAARALFAAMAVSPPVPVGPARSRADADVPGPASPPVDRTPEAPAPAPVAAPAAPAAATPVAAEVRPREGEPVPTVVEFAPRTGLRLLVGLLLLAALAATAVAAYAAYQDRSSTNLGVAGTLAVLTAIIWAIHASSAVATLTVRGGQLEIMRGGSRHRFDLASQYTPIEVVGEPGSRGWKVLFQRRSLAPYVIDSSMVDPVEFTRVLRHYRPEE